MLDREGDEHQHRADPEGGVQREADRAETVGEQRPAPQRGREGGDAILRDESGDGILRRLAGVEREPFGDAGRIRRHRTGMGGDPFRHVGIVGAGNGRQHVQDVSRRDGAAEREHGRPGEPVAPDREGRNQLGIAHPGRRAIDGGAAGLVGEEAGDFRIGEGLDEAHHHGDEPYEERHLSGGARNAADGEQDQRRHTARHPECPRQSMARFSSLVCPSAMGTVASIVMW